jgi:dienelactone hydrolase
MISNHSSIKKQPVKKNNINFNRKKPWRKKSHTDDLMSNLDFGDAATWDIRGAVQYLKGASPRVAVIVFCMGGVLSILAAVYAKETDAAVSWYGVPPEEATDTGSIKTAITIRIAMHVGHATVLSEAQVLRGGGQFINGMSTCEAECLDKENPESVHVAAVIM